MPEAAKQKLIELTQTAAVKAEGLTKKNWQNWIIGSFISAITAPQHLIHFNGNRFMGPR